MRMVTTEGRHLATPGTGVGGDLSQGQNPWSPPAADLRPSLDRSTRHLWLALPEGIAVGLIMGMIDINLPGTGDDWEMNAAYVGVASMLGARHGMWAWLAWPSLGVCLYLVHLVAIAHGYEQPFVEANSGKAIGCLGVLVPCGLGIGMGTFIRWGVKSLVTRRV